MARFPVTCMRRARDSEVPEKMRAKKMSTRKVTVRKTTLGKLSAVCLLFFIAAVAAHGQSAATTAAVADYVKSEQQRQHIPGLSLLVVKDGKIICAEGYGLANVELQVPVKPESVFQSGSVGKQFTATAVMMLVED